jgi:hypothetical protein
MFPCAAGPNQVFALLARGRTLRVRSPSQISSAAAIGLVLAAKHICVDATPDFGGFRKHSCAAHGSERLFVPAECDDLLRRIDHVLKSVDAQVFTELGVLAATPYWKMLQLRFERRRAPVDPDRVVFRRKIRKMTINPRRSSLGETPFLPVWQRPRHDRPSETPFCFER